MSWSRGGCLCLCIVALWIAHGACFGGNCVPQEVRDCRCLNGQEGLQICGPFGSEWSICSCKTPDGGSVDGATDGTSRRFLEAQYRSTSTEKVFVFWKTGRYKLYLTAEQQKADKPDLDSRYFVVGQKLHFQRADGSAFGSVGTLSQGDGQFTWAEFPAEVFKKN